MKIKILFLLIILGLKAHACSCTGPRTFLKSLKANILELKYVGYDSISEELSTGQILQWHFKKLVLIDIWQSSADTNLLNSKPKISLGDTLFLREGNGANCLGYLKDAVLNEHYLLSLSNQSLTIGSQENFPQQKNLVISLFLCSEPKLWLNGNQVKGNISKNIVYQKIASADRYLRFAAAFREKQYQFDSESFLHRYYRNWAQLNEKIYAKKRKRIMSKGNYYERGQTWSRKRLKKEILKRRLKSA